MTATLATGHHRTRATLRGPLASVALVRVDASTFHLTLCPRDGSAFTHYDIDSDWPSALVFAESLIHPPGDVLANYREAGVCA